MIAVFGILMTPLSWVWALGVWAYALFWFLIEDRVKLVTNRWLDRHPRRHSEPVECALTVSSVRRG